MNQPQKDTHTSHRAYTGLTDYAAQAKDSGNRGGSAVYIVVGQVKKETPRLMFLLGGILKTEFIILSLVWFGDPRNDNERSVTSTKSVHRNASGCNICSINSKTNCQKILNGKGVAKLNRNNMEFGGMDNPQESPRKYGCAINVWRYVMLISTSISEGESV